MLKTILNLLLTGAAVTHARAATIQEEQLAKVMPRLMQACEVLRQSAEVHLQEIQPQMIACRNAGRIPSPELQTFEQGFDRDCVEGLKAQIAGQLEGVITKPLEMNVDQLEVWDHFEKLYRVLYSRYCTFGSASL
jgi:hypothetical protein